MFARYCLIVQINVNNCFFEKEIIFLIINRNFVIHYLLRKKEYFAFNLGQSRVVQQMPFNIIAFIAWIYMYF